MSALTDLFTAFANKIRSKTGGSDTYTPPQMVNAIDDVYQAGVEAGTTPTQTKTVTAGTSATTVTPDTGYALSSVTVNPTPSQSKSATPTTSSQTITPDNGKLLSSVSVGAIPSEYIIPSGNKSITANGTGIDVSSYATASVAVPDPTTNALSPSNSSPQALVGKAYYRDANSSATTTIGYAISSYSSVTPSNSSPVSLSSGSIYKMDGAGKAVASVTSVAPSNSSPATLTSGTVYKPSANGVAISSYSSITPSSSSQPVSSGSIYKMGGNGEVVNAINIITPSNSTPVSLDDTKNYKPTISGFAIKSYNIATPSQSPQSLTAGELYQPSVNGGYLIGTYQPITPDADGEYFYSGMVQMGTSGYAYSQKPTLHETTLWTNSSPSSNYASDTVTLSSDIDNFDYIEVEFKSHKSQSSTQKTLMSVADFKLAKNSGFASQYTPRLAIGGSYNNNATVALRGVAYESDTQLIFGTCRAGTTTKNDYAIPVRVIGVSWY